MMVEENHALEALLMDSLVTHGNRAPGGCWFHDPLSPLQAAMRFSRASGERKPPPFDARTTELDPGTLGRLLDSGAPGLTGCMVRKLRSVERMLRDRGLATVHVMLSGCARQLWDERFALAGLGGFANTDLCFLPTGIRESTEELFCYAGRYVEMREMIELGREAKGDNLYKGFRATLGLEDDEHFGDFMRIALYARSRSTARPEAFRTRIGVAEFVCEDGACSGETAVRVPLLLQAAGDGRGDRAMHTLSDAGRAGLHGDEHELVDLKGRTISISLNALSR